MLKKYIKSIKRILQKLKVSIGNFNGLKDTGKDFEFDEDWYLLSYPDVKGANIDAKFHYINSGKSEKRLPLPPVKFKQNFFDNNLESIVIVVHEASRTGCPLMGLSFIQSLSKKYNIITILLKTGVIFDDISNSSSLIITSEEEYFRPESLGYAIMKISKDYKPKYAIVNSAASSSSLMYFYKYNIPSVFLNHELATAYHPPEHILNGIFWGVKSIFSSELAVNDLSNYFSNVYDYMLKNKIVIPQGKYSYQLKESGRNKYSEENDKFQTYIDNFNSTEEPYVVIGVGSVDYRKGTDLFVETARKAIEKLGRKDIIFIWLGSKNINTSYIYYQSILHQIRNYGLQENLFLADEFNNIEIAYKNADLLLITSRADTLPGTAFEAMSYQMPFLCFHNTIGTESLIIENGLENDIVVPFLDTDSMADKVVEYFNNRDKQKQIGEKFKKIADKEQHFEDYIKKVENIAVLSVNQFKQEIEDILFIEESEVLNSNYYRNDFMKNHTSREMAVNFVRSYSVELSKRKPFSGFHPGIYSDNNIPSNEYSNPLADYLRNGKPQGIWNYSTLNSNDDFTIPDKVEPFALHIHNYYPDVFSEILWRIKLNKLIPDIYISAPNESIKNQTLDQLQDYNGNYKIEIVPNIGRDIAPFLVTFGRELFDNYEIIGHVHTKKSSFIDDRLYIQSWIDFLYENMLGGRTKMMDSIISKMISDPKIGLIFPDDPNVLNWGINTQPAKELFNKLSIDFIDNKNFDFPTGNMFWCRANSLRKLLELDLNYKNMPKEPIKNDGTILHALERMTPFIAEISGYKILKTYVEGIAR